jgi:beta-1,4-mannosyltransferase
MEQYGLENVTTLMDRPPERYSPLNESAQSLFLETLSETRGVDRSNTKILVTSTSYTADEPLQPLLSALLKYSRTENASLPHILLLITGRGPMQEGYRKMIEQSSFSGKDPDEKCTVKMVWLEPQDYPRLLACADLGISLHTSSSGLDFPMKIVDLYGCGVPVCAIRFDA